jgi:uncharacterized protein YlbG (UPF0298 family)
VQLRAPAGALRFSFVAGLFIPMVLYGIRKEGKSMVERQGIIVYLQHLKQAKSFRKYGHVHYISRKMKYVVLYCDMEDVDTTMSKIERLPSVKKVLPSYRPFVKTEYENAKPDKAKEYDYKAGL